MALGRFVVGEAWVELQLDTDPLQRKLATTLPDSETSALGNKWGRSAGQAFANAFASSAITGETIARIRRGGENAGDQAGNAGGQAAGRRFADGFASSGFNAATTARFRAGGENAGDQAGTAAKNALERKLAQLHIEPPNLSVNINEAMANIQRVERELNDLNNDEANIDVRIDSMAAIAELERLKARIRDTHAEIHVDVDYDTLGSKVRHSVGGALSSLFTPNSEVFTELFDFFRTGVSRSLISLFSSPAGMAVGAALIAMLGVAIAGAASFLGGILTAAIVGGLNLGIIAGGIALVAQHPRIKKAGQELADKLFNGLEKAARPFINTTVDAIERLKKTVDRVMPSITHIFKVLAPWVTKFADAFGGALEKIMPALDRMVSRSGPVMDAIAQLIRDSGSAIAGFLDNLTRDPEAMKGAAAAIRDLGLAFKAILPAMGSFLAELAKTWPQVSPFFKEIFAIVKRMLEESFDWNQFRQGLKDSLQLIELVLKALDELQNFSVPGGDLMTLFSPFPVEAYTRAWEIAVPKIKAAWKDFRDDLDDLGNHVKNAWKDIVGWLEGLADKIKNAFNGIKDFFKNPLGGGGGGQLSTEGNPFESLKNAAERVRDGVIGAFQALSSSVASIMGGIGSTVSNVWNGMFATVTGIASGISSGVSGIFQGLWGTVSGIWNGISGAISGAANAAWGAATGAFSALSGTVSGIFQGLFGTVSGVWGGITSAISGAWNAIQGVFNAMIGFVSGMLSALWSNLLGHITGVWNGILGAISGAWNAIQGALNATIGFISGIFSSLWTNLLGHIAGIWNGIRNVIDGAWNAIQGALNATIGFISGVFSALWSNLLGHIAGIWNGIRNVIDGAWNAIQGALNATIGFVSGVFSALWSNLQGHIAGVWNGIRNAIDGAWNAIRGALENTIGFVSTPFSALWTNIRNHISGNWNGIRNAIDGAWTAIKGALENMISFVSTPFSALWTNIHNHISGIMGAITGKFGDFKNSTVRIFSEIRDTIGRIWNEMIGAAKSAIHTMAGFLNAAIDAVNKIPFMKDKIGRLEGFANGGEIKMAYGGAVFGGPSGTDTVPAWGSNGQRYLLDNGEHILTKSDVKAMGGQDSVYSFRRSLHMTGDQFFSGGSVKLASGGRVDGRNNGLLEQHRNHVHVAMNVPPMGFPLIIAKAATSGIPHQVGSTFRPGSRGSGGGLDHHSEGRAVDFPGFNQDRFAGWWESQAGVIELIHRTNARDYAIFGGKASGGGLGGAIGWILSAAGKAVKALFDKAVGGFKGFIGGDLLKGNTMAPTILRNMGNAMLGNITSFFDEQSSFGDGGGGSAAGSAQLKAWIEEAKKYVGIEWVEGLITLIMRESGGNPRAINRSDSNAARGDPSRGLMQTIGSTFSANRDSRLPNDIYDPVANIVAGMNYIHRRYGSLRNVQQAYANKPPKGYWEGTRNAPKGEAMVGEAGAEMINFGGGESVTPIDGGVWRINNMHVSIEAKDLAEVTTVTQWFAKLQQEARKGSRVG